jgi:hypothetical protein
MQHFARATTTYFDDASLTLRIVRSGSPRRIVRAVASCGDSRNVNPEWEKANRALYFPVWELAGGPTLKEFIDSQRK